jgi:hypothetical protein
LHFWIFTPAEFLFWIWKKSGRAVCCRIAANVRE